MSFKVNPTKKLQVHIEPHVNSYFNVLLIFLMFFLDQLWNPVPIETVIATDTMT